MTAAMLTAILLALAGGAAIAIQNTIMGAVVARGVDFTGTLIINSTIGLSVLVAIAMIRSGPAFVVDIAAHARPWFVLPGLLGTFFVFAGVFGYRHLGAATTIVLVVAAQLATGIALDAIGVTGASRPIGLQTLLGAALIVTGALLVVR
jgi:bacterial/archaeal transporter family-2 protein